MLIQALATVRGLTPYSPSKQYVVEEGVAVNDAFDAAHWRDHLHTEKGAVVIPGISFKQAMDAAAKRRGEKIVGGKGRTFTKVFASALSVFENPSLGIPADAEAPHIVCERLMQNSDGVRGSGKRVPRRFPLIASWQTTVAFMVFDEQITEAVFTRHLTDAGRYVGVGRWRPENGGINGRFEVVKVQWNLLSDEAAA